MTRAARLQAAKHWLPTYRGGNLVRGYRKWFGVSDVCAVLELRMLGVDLPDARLEQARRDEQARAGRRTRQKEQHARADDAGEWDEEFAFIAGYTEGGAPYGIRWDDPDDATVHERARRRAVDVVRDAARLMDDDADLPF
ncbi:MAG TPA: hypothetical protein VF006_09640 [Longimicrobium sp.]